MPWYDGLATMLNQGYVPGGTTPQVSVDGGAPGYQGTDQISSLARAAQKMQAEFELKQKKEMEKLAKKIDMYKTLRESGYEPSKAHKAVESSELVVPAEVDAPFDTSEKTTEDKILAKKAAGEKLTAGEEEIYQDKIIRPKNDEGSLNQLTAAILQKVADYGYDSLKPGEKKVYEDYLKKNRPASIWDGYDPGGDQEAVPEEPKKASIPPQAQVKPAEIDTMVPVISPDGKNGSIPKSKLARALKLGYKTR
jgi:hypothetical protein